MARKRIVEFKYDIGDEVKIKAVSVNARVNAMLLDSTGVQYHVIYWDDGERRLEWVYEWELS